MSLRVSPVSKIAAILIIVVGFITLLVSYPAGETLGEVMGLAFIVLGVVLYGMLYRFKAWVESEVKKAEHKAASATANRTNRLD